MRKIKPKKGIKIQKRTHSPSEITTVLRGVLKNDSSSNFIHSGTLTAGLGSTEVSTAVISTLQNAPNGRLLMNYRVLRKPLTSKHLASGQAKQCPFLAKHCKFKHSASLSLKKK